MSLITRGCWPIRLLFTYHFFHLQRNFFSLKCLPDGLKCNFDDSEIIFFTWKESFLHSNLFLKCDFDDS